MVSSPCGPAKGGRRHGITRAGAVRRVDRQPVRLTRRGRRIRGALVSTALAGALVVLPALVPSAGVASPDRGVGRSHVVVRPGDSIWSVAVRHAPDRDPSVTVEEVRRLNHLPGYVVHPGQRLRLP